MTPENKQMPSPDDALDAFRQAGKILTKPNASRMDDTIASIMVIQAYAFMHGITKWREDN